MNCAELWQNMEWNIQEPDCQVTTGCRQLEDEDYRDQEEALGEGMQSGIRS
jgi:hypothetical protein